MDECKRGGAQRKEVIDWFPVQRSQSPSATWPLFLRRIHHSRTYSPSPPCYPLPFISPSPNPSFVFPSFLLLYVSQPTPSSRIHHHQPLAEWRSPFSSCHGGDQQAAGGGGRQAPCETAAEDGRQAARPKAPLSRCSSRRRCCICKPPPFRSPPSSLLSSGVQRLNRREPRDGWRARRIWAFACAILAVHRVPPSLSWKF